MKSPLSHGAFRAPLYLYQRHADTLRKATNLRTARIAGAVSLVVGAGAASILFVDYLADRAKQRVAALAPVQVAQNDAPAAPTRLALAGIADSGSFSRRVEGMIVQPAAAATTAAPANPHAVEPVPATIVQDNVPPATAHADGTVTAAIGTQAADAAAAPLDGVTAGTQPVTPEVAQPPGYEPAPKVVKTVKIAAIDPSLTAPVDEEAATTDEVDDNPITVTPSPAPRRPKAVKSSPAKPAKTLSQKAKVTKVAAKQTPSKVTGSARINRHVNLRVRPDNDSKVVTIVPVNARVNVLYCKDWCEVTYGGKRGYVYKRFVGKT